MIGVGHREANVVQFEFQAPLSASLAHGPAVLNSATPAICAAIWPFRIARLRMWTIWACSFRIVLLHLRSIWTPLLWHTWLGAYAIRGGSPPPSALVLLALFRGRPVPCNWVYHWKGFGFPGLAQDLRSFPLG